MPRAEDGDDDGSPVRYEYIRLEVWKEGQLRKPVRIPSLHQFPDCIKLLARRVSAFVDFGVANLAQPYVIVGVVVAMDEVDVVQFNPSGPVASVTLLHPSRLLMVPSDLR